MVSHPLSMREALGSIPRLSTFVIARPAPTLLVTTTTPVGFEPTRGDPIGLAGRRLNRLAKVSMYVERGHLLLAHTHTHPGFAGIGEDGDSAEAAGSSATQGPAAIFVCHVAPRPRGRASALAKRMAARDGGQGRRGHLRRGGGAKQPPIQCAAKKRLGCLRPPAGALPRAQPVCPRHPGRPTA